MNDLARIIQHMTAAAKAGLTPAQCLERDLQQTADFNAWQREVDAVGESAEMESLTSEQTWRGATVFCPSVGNGELTPGPQDSPSLPSNDAFSFTAECRELAAHFMPGAPGHTLDYFAQYIHECASEWLDLQKEFGK